MGVLGADLLTQLMGQPFYGNGFDRVQLDEQLALHWRDRQVDVENERLAQTWFDYRHCHPVLRSHFFYHAYTLAWRRAHRRHIDVTRDVSHFTPWPGRRPCLYFQKPQTIMATIDAMHFADELRIPYDVFMDAAFEHLLQERGWRASHSKARDVRASILPPVRLFRDGDVAIAAQRAFERRNARTIRLAQHAHYKASRFMGLEWQREYQRYLVTEVRGLEPRSRTETIAGLVRRNALTLDTVGEHFGPDMIAHLGRETA